MYTKHHNGLTFAMGDLRRLALRMDSLDYM